MVALRLFTLGDFLMFVNWMTQVEKALDQAEALPAMPSELESGKVRAWVELVHRLEERFRQSEERKVALEASVMAQESKLGELLSDLHVNTASLYENLEQPQRAEEMRRRAEALRCR